MEIFKLFGSIFIDDKEADSSLKKMDKKTNSFSKQLGKGIKTAAKWGAALAAGAAVALGAMVGLGIKVGNAADEILDLNSITGMSTDSVQEWRKVAEVAGISVDSMANASMKLTKNLDAMSVEGQKGQEALGELGLSLSEIESMSADERMNTLTEALAGVDDKTERARIGTDLFGGSWKEIAPAVDLGTEAMKKAKDSANIISEEDLVKANNFRITVEDMKDQVGFFVTEIGIALLPMLQGLFDWFQENMPLMQEVAGTAFGYLTGAVSIFSNFIRDQVIPILISLWEWIEPNIPLIQEFFVSAFGIIKDVLNVFSDAIVWVIENLGALLPIIMGVTAAVLAQMIINGLISAYKTWQTVTKTQTALQWLLNVALNANPLGLVAIAIGAVVAAGVLLYKNWDTVKEKLGQLWSSMQTIFGNIGSFVGGVWDGMVSGIKSGVNAIIGAVNGMIRGLNGVSFDVPDWVPIMGGKEFGFSIPQIPMLAKGGNVLDGGAFIAGEAGPELISNASGATVTPLSTDQKNLTSKSEENTNGNTKGLEALLVELIQAVKEEKDLIIDGKTFAKVTGEERDKEGGTRLRRNERGLAY